MPTENQVRYDGSHSADQGTAPVEPARQEQDPDDVDQDQDGHHDAEPRPGRSPASSPRQGQPHDPRQHEVERHLDRKAPHLGQPVRQVGVDVGVDHQQRLGPQRGRRPVVAGEEQQRGDDGQDVDRNDAEGALPSGSETSTVPTGHARGVRTTAGTAESPRARRRSRRRCRVGPAPYRTRAGRRRRPRTRRAWRRRRPPRRPAWSPAPEALSSTVRRRATVSSGATVAVIGGSEDDGCAPPDYATAHAGHAGPGSGAATKIRSGLVTCPRVPSGPPCATLRAGLASLGGDAVQKMIVACWGWGVSCWWRGSWRRRGRRAW